MIGMELKGGEKIWRIEMVEDLLFDFNNQEFIIGSSGKEYKIKIGEKVDIVTIEGRQPYRLSEVVVEGAWFKPCDADSIPQTFLNKGKLAYPIPLLSADKSPRSDDRYKTTGRLLMVKELKEDKSILLVPALI